MSNISKNHGLFGCITNEQRERIAAAKDAWLAAASARGGRMAARGAHRREVIRLWLEYVELANPVCARKIRRLLKYGEIDPAKTASELPTEAAVPVSNLPQMTPLRGDADQIQLR